MHDVPTLLERVTRAYQRATGTALLAVGAVTSIAPGMPTGFDGYTAAIIGLGATCTAAAFRFIHAQHAEARPDACDFRPELAASLLPGISLLTVSLWMPLVYFGTLLLASRGIRRTMNDAYAVTTANRYDNYRAPVTRVTLLEPHDRLPEKTSTLSNESENGF